MANEEDKIAAFVLAGGKSARMGKDKAFLKLGGSTLLAHALALAGSVSTRVRIVGARERFSSYGEVIEDEFPGQGPLAGIHAALSSRQAELNLVLAVDMPLLRPEFLIYLVEEACRSRAVVTAAKTAAGWQPLCAVYGNEFLAIAEEALGEGRNKIDPLFARVATRVIDEGELEEENFSEKMFRNLNTPKELAEAQGEIGG